MGLVNMGSLKFRSGNGSLLGTELVKIGGLLRLRVAVSCLISMTFKD